MQPTIPDWLQDIRQAEQLFDQKRLDEAGELAARALTRNPNAALAYQVLALIRVERFQFREAIPLLEQALALRPDLVPSHNGLAQCYMHLDDLDRALAALHTALCLDPQHAFAHFNRALLWLKRGQFREGWVEYEWRFAAGLVQRPELPRPRWDGGAVDNRSILVHTEQGLGDVLQFARLLPVIRRKARRLVVACPTPQRSFLSSLSCIDEFFPVDEPGEVHFDVCCALLSLPALLRHDGSEFYSSVPYVYADPQRVQSWGERLRSARGFKIGLAWQGSPTFRGDAFRSIPLRYFAALAQVPGVTLFSLQAGPGTEQVEANRQQLPITVFPNLDDDGIFRDTAAIMQHLDLVISSDSAVAHLAGALGRPAWVLLARNSDWRWLIDRPDSPWYPTMRLFRQWTLGDWTTVFGKVAVALQQHVEELAKLVPKGGATGIVAVEVALGELSDKITILQIKQERISDAAKLGPIRAELAALTQARDTRCAAAPELDRLTAALKAVNERLWQIEDDIRLCERDGDFGARFVELARSVYRTNDERAALKRQINELVGASFAEQKSYTDYGRQSGQDFGRSKTNAPG